MDFCLEDSHYSDEMSEASASAYSDTDSEPIVTVGNAEDLCVEEEGQETAVVDDLEAVDDGGQNRLDNELLTDQPDVPMAVQDQLTGGDRIALVAHEKDDEDLVTADSLVTADDLVTANDLATVNEPTESSANIYSAYTPPLSETFVDMDDLEPNGGKTAKTNVYAPPINENDVDMEQDVVGGASPMSTAITGSISWYSMPPSETNVEVVSDKKASPRKEIEVVERIENNHQIAYSEEVHPYLDKCQDDPEILEIDKSSTKVELNNAFLDDEEIDRDSQLSEFDTAVEA
ncbi:hypothetical protein Q1695_008139 [Nippostrongylus brasiliensis]|nr:hypothetical protein Q1695_008139 [Nippostrongylus brasiliensis]